MPTIPALISLFNAVNAGTSGLFCADLYSITLFNGTVLRVSTADFDILAYTSQGTSPEGPFLFPSGGVRVDQKESKVQAHWKLGFDVDTLVVVMMPRPIDIVSGAAFPDRIGSVPWLQAASAGYLDGADFQVDRAYFASVPTWPMPPGGAVPIGTKTIFAGIIAEVDTTDTIAAITVNDYRSLLTMQMPRHFYQSQCRHTLFDNGCTLSAAAFAVNGTVAAGSTRQTIVAPTLAHPGGSGTYALGRIVMTSGANNGFSATIKTWDGTNLALFAPLPFTPAPTDTFTAYPGCNKSLTACTQFNNLVNFGGFPFIPPPEIAT